MELNKIKNKKPTIKIFWIINVNTLNSFGCSLLTTKNKKEKTVKDIKPYTLHIPRTLSITEVNAYQCREIDDKEYINRILGKIN